MIRPSEEDYQEWKDGYITKEFFKYLIFQANEKRYDAARGSCMGKSMNETGETYYKYIQTALIYEDLVHNVTYDDIFPIEEQDENKASRVQSTD